MVDRIFASITRTVVPAIVGLIVAALLKVGLQVDDTLVTDLVTVTVTGLYYGAVRWLEVNVSPKLGWFIGAPGAPKYEAAA